MTESTALTPAAAPDGIADDLLEGVREIADFVGKTPRQVNHLLETKQLPGAFKLGAKWHLRRSTFRQRIREMEDAAA